jgi:Kef-type K+ transport system membrane component KefB
MSLLIQIPFVILVTLTSGAVARRLGQSRVIGEIVGGILLGPSVFGRFAPTAEGALFPPILNSVVRDAIHGGAHSFLVSDWNGSEH